MNSLHLEGVVVVPGKYEDQGISLDVKLNVDGQNEVFISGYTGDIGVRVGGMGIHSAVPIPGGIELHLNPFMYVDLTLVGTNKDPRIPNCTAVVVIDTSTPHAALGFSVFDPHSILVAEIPETGLYYQNTFILDGVAQPALGPHVAP